VCNRAATDAYHHRPCRHKQMKPGSKKQRAQVVSVSGLLSEHWAAMLLLTATTCQVGTISSAASLLHVMLVGVSSLSTMHQLPTGRPGISQGQQQCFSNYSPLHSPT